MNEIQGQDAISRDDAELMHALQQTHLAPSQDLHG